MTEYGYNRKFEDALGESPMVFSADVRMDCAFVGFSNGDGEPSGELLVREQDFPALLEAMRLAYNAGIRDAADGMREIEGAEFKSRCTDEFQSAVDVVCGACPYRADVCGEQGIEADEKYCGRCMVRLMCDLFTAEDTARSHLTDESPEWQAIINY